MNQKTTIWRRNPSEASIVVIDVQEKLFPHIQNKDLLEKKITQLLKAADFLSIPIFITEQYPQGLGPTISALGAWVSQNKVTSKTTFSIGQDYIQTLAGDELIVCGVETHVCVRQSVLDALSLGKKVTILADAVGSRHETDYEKALAELREAGASILTVESLVFEWMEDSKHPQFKNISALFKG